MKRSVLAPVLAFTLIFSAASASAQQASFRVLALYSKDTEPDHVQFAEQAICFFTALAKKDGFEFTSSDRWDSLRKANLTQYQVLLWLNDTPGVEQQRRIFEQYMLHGGAWLGFPHAGGCNDKSTGWPWFVDFLGGGVFYSNSWPPLPAKLRIDDKANAVTRNLPSSFTSPANEWYIWDPDPHLNADVKVLISLDPSNYPLGFKDVLGGGDLPVVWTNTKYRMIYTNMGHVDRIFTDPTHSMTPFTRNSSRGLDSLTRSSHAW